MNTVNTNLTFTKVGETLTRNDFSPAYIQEMQARLCGRFTPEELVETPNVLSQVADWIQEDVRIVSPLEDKGTPRVIAVVGPDGAGKTSVIAKLASELKWSAQENHAKSPAIRMITTDGLRAEGKGKLERVAVLLDLDVDVAASHEELVKLLKAWCAPSAGTDYVLIDMSGYNPCESDSVRQQMRDILNVEDVDIDVHLVIPATMKACDLAYACKSYGDLGFGSSAIVTQCDSTGSFGNVLSVLHSYQLPISWISDGPEILHTLKKADPEYFMKRLVGFGPDTRRNWLFPAIYEDRTFDSFVIGDNNDEAYTSCLAIAKKPGQATLFNPLFLYGGSGMGKTHLLLAIGNYIKANGRNSPKICYTTAENFQNKVLAAFKNNTVETFVNKCSCFNVFLMDNIQFLSSKMGVQETILKIVAGLKEHDAQLVFTSDRPLKEMSGLDERLRNLIGSGAAVEIAPPHFETRQAILQKNLELRGRDLPDEIISYIARNVQSNVRDLEGFLNKVLGYSELTGQVPELEKVRDLLKDCFVEDPVDSDALPEEG